MSQCAALQISFYGLSSQKPGCDLMRVLPASVLLSERSSQRKLDSGGSFSVSGNYDFCAAVSKKNNIL